MPPVPPDQVSPYGVPNDDANAPYLSTHLTMEELALRWRRKRKTIERHYARWGLRAAAAGRPAAIPAAADH
jgi:hypothetical protein